MIRVVDRIDPRVILLGFFSTALWIGTASTGLSTAAWAGSLTVVSWGVRRSLPDRLRLPHHWLWWMLGMALLTFLLHMVFSGSGAEPFFRVGPVTLYSQGAVLGFRMAMRLWAFVCLSITALSCLSPGRLTAGVTRMLMPLRFLGFPVASLYYFVFFLLRMFPTLMDESQVIRLAQRSRGIRFNGSIVKRSRASAAVAVPVLAAGLRRSDRLAMSLAARGFDARRIPLAVGAMRFAALDWAVAGVLLLGWGGWVAARLI
ncbi:MAG: hypothetical protein HY304_09315 [candidate division Zixibacteria bacterium]|nr:hypothetical protein [candidate division Zixibacteria bacterium]